MRFKYNPWVSIVAAILLAAVLVLTCTGCSNTAEEPTAEETTQPRFRVEKAGCRDRLSIYIITDTDTGVQYMFVYDVAGHSGLTRLEG